MRRLRVGVGRASEAAFSMCRAWKVTRQPEIKNFEHSVYRVTYVVWLDVAMDINRRRVSLMELRQGIRQGDESR